MQSHTTLIVGIVFGIVLCSILICGIANWYGVPERYAAWQNRRRHPNLALEYRFETEYGKSLIADRMLVSDRIQLHDDNGDLPSGQRYPDIWDYHIPKGRRGLLQARKRRAARLADVQEVRRQIA